MLKLRELRKEQKISQEELAEKFSLERSTISRWENGQNEPSIEILLKLAEMFEVSVDYLIGRDGVTKHLATDSIYNQVVKQHGLTVAEALTLFLKLKKTDQDRIIGRMETFVEVDLRSVKTKIR